MNELIKKEIYKIYPELDSNDPRSPHYVRKLKRNNNLVKELSTLILSFIIVWLLNLIILKTFESNFMGIIISSVLFMKYPVKKFLIVTIKTYQNYAPDYIRNKCRFEPSCSQYAIKILDKYILPISLYKICNRLYRCSFTKDGGFEDI